MATGLPQTNMIAATIEYQYPCPWPVPPARSGVANAHATPPAAVIPRPTTRVAFSPRNLTIGVDSAPLTIAQKAAGCFEDRLSVKFGLTEHMPGVEAIIKGVNTHQKVHCRKNRSITEQVHTKLRSNKEPRTEATTKGKYSDQHEEEG